MRINKQNKIIVGILAFLLTLTVGYAVFSQSLNITGTAEASGNFSLIFSSVKSVVEHGSSGASATREDNNKTLKIEVPNLEYPTAYVDITAEIKNEGSIDALLEEIEVSGLSDNDIKVTYKLLKDGNEINLEKDKDVIESGKTRDIVITVTWDENSTKSEVTLDEFSISLKYEQATSLADSGGGGTSSESDWTFKVNDSGTIMAYNYSKGTDVVVPAYVDGVAVTTISRYSFYNGNVKAYQDEDYGKMYMIIYEDKESDWESVKEKTTKLFSSDSCDEEDAECLEQMKQMIYFCKDENTCYSASDESIVTSIPEGLEQAGALYMNPDSSLSIEESFSVATLNITSLDLSQATNLTTIGKRAFDEAGLQSLNFGENSSIKTIGDYSFIDNQIKELIIPKSVTYIGEHAFTSNPLETILIKRTEEDFLANVTVVSGWYGYGSPTITYQGE